MEARRKSIERRSQVNGISPEAKVAATTLAVSSRRRPRDSVLIEAQEKDEKSS